MRRRKVCLSPDCGLPAQQVEGQAEKMNQVIEPCAMFWFATKQQGSYPHSQCDQNIKKECQGDKMVTKDDMSHDNFKKTHTDCSMNHIISLMILNSLLRLEI